ncbi:MAG: TlpA family protein disulfide reductase [Chloroflexi bacterium]|nr:MAG: TlpA family protein disulfide reductase [Chloroflexota bacterium]
MSGGIVQRRLATVLILAGAAALLSACSLQQDVAVAPPSGKIGIPAPALSGQTLDGAPITVEFRNRKTVLLFWASWCGPCRHEQPFLNRMATDYATRGVQFIGVDILDHDHAAAKAFEDEFHVPYPSLYDDAGKTAATYNVDAPPSQVLVDGRGIIVARTPGEVSEDQLGRLIQAKLLAS